MKPSPRAYDGVKRLADVFVSVVALVVLSPVLAVLALMVWRDVGSPVIFSQLRPGKDGQLFRMYKFRTMRVGAPEQDVESMVASDASRLTAFGSRLRASSLDELPELFNVLRGEMSIVGPRPLLPEYLDRYNDVQARRHEVRPGITGWAQVNGRNDTSWEDRFALDVYYVDNRSPVLDAKIVFKTIATVLKREGVSAQGHVTMEPFDPHHIDTREERDSE